MCSAQRSASTPTNPSPAPTLPELRTSGKLGFLLLSPAAREWLSPTPRSLAERSSSAHESRREAPRLGYFRGWAPGEDAQCLKGAGPCPGGLRRRLEARSRRGRGGCSTADSAQRAPLRASDSTAPPRPGPVAPAPARRRPGPRCLPSGPRCRCPRAPAPC